MAFQRNAFQDNAFQMDEQIQPGAAPSRQAFIPVISGHIKEYEHKHIEEIKALILITGIINNIQANAKNDITTKYKDKSEIDLEILLMVLLDD